MTHNIGSTLTLREAGALPLGTKLNSNGHTYVLTEDGAYYEYGERMQIFNYNETDRFTLTSFGSGSPAVPQTVEQFKDKFATLAVGAGRQSSVAGVEDALLELGIDPNEVILRLGMFVHRYHSDRLESLPEGTVLSWGLTQGTQYGQAVLSVVRGSTVEDLWTNQSGASMMQVISFPEGTEVHEWREPREDEAMRLAAFRSKAAAVGMVAKERNSWCGVAEATMGKVFMGDIEVVTGHCNTGGVWVPREGTDMTATEEFRAAAPYTTWMVNGRTLLRKFSDMDFRHLTQSRSDALRFHLPATEPMSPDTHPGQLAQISNAQMVWLPMMEPSNTAEVTDMDSWMAPTGSRVEAADGQILTKRDDGTWHHPTWGVAEPVRWVKYLPFNSPDRMVRGDRAVLIGDEPAHCILLLNGYYYRSLGAGHWMHTAPHDRFRPADMAPASTWAVGHHSDWSYPTAWTGLVPGRGDAVTTEDMLHAPVGVMIEEDGDAWTLDHYEDGVSQWMHHNSTGAESFVTPSGFDLEDMTWKRIRVFRHDRMPSTSIAQFLLPVGTVLRNPNTEAWMFRSEDGRWFSPTLRGRVVDEATFLQMYEDEGICEALIIGCNP